MGDQGENREAEKKVYETETIIWEREREFIQHFLFVSSSALPFMLNHPPPIAITTLKQEFFSYFKNGI